MVSDLLIARMEKRIIDLENKLSKQTAATNFILTHLLKVLDNASEEDNKLSDELKKSLNESLSKINSGQGNVVKAAINELLQPSLRTWGQDQAKFLD